MNARPETHSSAVSRGEMARIAVLGLNAWIVSVAVPSLYVGDLDVALALGGAPLIPLVLGVLALGRHLERARWMLLATFPIAIGAVLAAQPKLSERDVFGDVGIVFAAGSMLAFVAASAHAVGRRRAERDVQIQPLIGKEPVAEPASRRFVRRALLVSTGVGAMALALLAPTLASRSERMRVWGDAVDDATVLTIVIGTITAGLVLGVLVGPTLRASRATRDRPVQRRIRIALALSLAVGAGAGWVFLTLRPP
jgi:hypothetical protein